MIKSKPLMVISTKHNRKSTFSVKTTKRQIYVVFVLLEELSLDLSGEINKWGIATCLVLSMLSW